MKQILKFIVCIMFLIIIFIYVYNLFTFKSISSNQYTETSLGNKYKISGYVKNNEDHEMSNITIELTNVNGETQSVQTNEQGFFSFDVKEGDYTLKIDCQEYKCIDINKGTQNEYSFQNYKNIDFIYPQNNSSVEGVLEEVVNKLKSIGNNSSDKKINVYSSYSSFEGNMLNSSSDKILSNTLYPRKNLIFIFVENDISSFLENLIDEKRQSIGRGPFPYKIIIKYLQPQTSNNIQNLLAFPDFVSLYEGELSKQPLLEKLYEELEIEQKESLSFSNEGTSILDYQENNFAYSKTIKIQNRHDNDTTNNILIKLSNDTNDVDDPNEEINNGQQNEEQNDIDWDNMEKPNSDGSTTIRTEDEFIIDDGNGNTITERLDIGGVLKKDIVGYRVTLADGSILFQGNLTDNPDDINNINTLKMKKLEIDTEIIQGALLEIEYRITYTINEEIAKKIPGLKYDLTIYDFYNMGGENTLSYDQNAKLITSNNIMNKDQGWSEVKTYGTQNYPYVDVKLVNDNANSTNSISTNIVLSRLISSSYEDINYVNAIIPVKLHYSYANDLTGKDVSISTFAKSPTFMIFPPTGIKH